LKMRFSPAPNAVRFAPVSAQTEYGVVPVLLRMT
jgi:hypothetical protein